MIDKFSDLLASQAIKNAIKIFQLTLVLALCFYLLNKLSSIGWTDLLASLPESFLFYIILLLNFLLLPYSELLIYGPLWPNQKTEKLTIFTALMRKQAFNDAIIGYSGEAFFFLWVRQHIGLSTKKAFSVIKDNNLISAAISATAALGIVLLFSASGQLSVLTHGMTDIIPYIIGALIAGILVVPLIMLFGHHIIALPKKHIRRIATLHALRILVFESLLILQWSIVLPSVPLSVWIGFVAAKMVLTRIPMMPNKDLMLLGLAVSLSEYVPAATAALAALFLASTTITQLLNAFAIFLTSLPGITGKNRNLA